MFSIDRGAVCFTFDDGRYQQWLPLLPLFERYQAHGTFFFHGAITTDVIEAMQALQTHGHSIGLHSLNHRHSVDIFAERGGEAYLEEEVLPQLIPCTEAGVNIRFFAYPDNVHSDETDQFLAQTCGFTRFRAGIGGHLPKGYAIADQDAAYYSIDQLRSSLALGGNGIGEYYASTQENLDAAMERAANEKKLLVFFSHGISDQPGLVDVSTSMLETTLQKARELPLDILNFDELDSL